MKIKTFLVALLITNLCWSQTELVDSNFDKQVYKEDKKLKVVAFYATWCGYCKKLDPVLKELSSVYKNQVDFFKMDVDENEKDDFFERTGVPAIYLFYQGKSIDTIGGYVDNNGMIYYLDKAIKKYDIKEIKRGLNDGYINHIWDDWKELNTMAWHAYNKKEDSNSLLLGIKAVKQSIQLNEKHTNLNTYASLLYKIKKYKRALKYVNRAIEVAKKDGVKYTASVRLKQDIENQIKE